MNNKSIAIAAAEGRNVAPVHLDRLDRIAELSALLNRCDSLNGPIPVGTIADVENDRLQIVRLDPSAVRSALQSLLDLVGDLNERCQKLDDLLHGAAMHSHSQKARTQAALESKAISTFVANRMELIAESLSSAYQPNNPASDL